ncbi:MAG: PAS domain-containing sensor histidine kinase, partial [Candidatus Anammoxibacter sp.]
MPTEPKPNPFPLQQENDELFRMVVQNMPVMMNAFDANSNFIVWNIECEKVTGFKAGEIIDNPKAMELIYPEGTNYRYVLSKLVNNKDDYRNREMQIACKNGDIKTILWSNISNQFPIRGWDKWVVGIDISKSKQMKIELVEKTIYLDSILSSAKDMAIIALDNNYQIKYFNPMAEEIFRYKPENVIGNNIFDVYKQLTVDSDIVKSAIDEIRDKGVYSFIFQQDKEVGGRFLQMRISGILDINDKSAGYVLMANDITERIRGEKLLKKHTDDLARSNEELEQFAYIASHDLQEPLRMITSYLQLLENRYKGKLDKDADDFIGFAVDGAARMQTLINDILTYSHVGRDLEDFTSVDCNVILEQVITTLQTTIKEKNAAIIYDPLPTVIADELLMNQLFQNLISNALKFCKSSPQIKIDAILSDEDFLFSVSDNGIGIAPECINRVFLMFQRLHTKAEYRGTGIGLPICKKIVERHGGRIWIESKPGQGSKFCFTIPI